MSKFKKKDMWTWKDTIFWYTSFFACILLFISLLPPVPWRYAAPQPKLGARFPVPRKVSLFTLGNQFQQPIAWFKMKALVCRQSQEFQRPNPLAMGVALGNSLISAQTEGQVAASGAMLGCAVWESCKAHAAARCSTYMSIAMVGVGAFLLILFGIISAVMSIIFLHSERRVKKKKKREAAQWNTALAGIFAFILPFFGTLVWTFGTQEMFKGLKATGYYPFPAAHAGIYMSLIACLMLGVSMVIGIRRQDIFQRVDDDSGDEEYAPAAHTGMLQPGMQPGMPPGMQQGYGVPPGMPQPGMSQAGMPPGMGLPPPPPRA